MIKASQINKRFSKKSIHQLHKVIDRRVKIFMERTQEAD